VIEEVAYILVKERAREETNIEKHYDLLHFLRNNPKSYQKFPGSSFRHFSHFVDKAISREKMIKIEGN